MLPPAVRRMQFANKFKSMRTGKTIRSRISQEPISMNALAACVWSKTILLSFLYFHWLFPLLARETSSGNCSIYKSTRERVDSKGLYGGDAGSIWWAPDEGNILKADSPNKRNGKDENWGSLTSAVFAISIIAFFTSAIVWSMKIVT